MNVILFTLPALLLMLIFVIYPSVMGIVYSFFSWDGISSSQSWVGLQNYLDIMQDDKFVHSVLFTIEFTVVNVLATNIVGLLLAFFVNMKIRASKLFRAIFFLPQIITIVVATYIWTFVFINAFKQFYDITGLSIFSMDWFGKPGLAFIMIIIVSIWISAGYLMLIYLAGLKNVDASMIDAAHIDGAKPGQIFFHVQLPLIMPSIVICMFITTLGSFKVFELIFTLTEGGPYDMTQTIAMNVYEEAFTNFHYGLASAKSVVLFIMVLIVTYLEVYYLKSKEVEA